MNQILVMWIRIWGTLNQYEKDIICGMLNKNGVKWGELNDSLDISVATLNKYLKNLQDKGIIKFFNRKYSLEDLMLETWLNHQRRFVDFIYNYNINDCSYLTLI